MDQLELPVKLDATTGAPVANGAGVAMATEDALLVSTRVTVAGAEVAVT